MLLTGLPCPSPLASGQLRSGWEVQSGEIVMRKGSGKTVEKSFKIVPLGAPFTFMFTTYVLRSRATGRFYTGFTSDLLCRLEQHNADVSISTKHRGPWELAHKRLSRARPGDAARTLSRDRQGPRGT